MPARPSLVQKPRCRLLVKSLLYASTPGELQRIQRLPSLHTSSTLLPAPTPFHSHAKDQFCYWFTIWYGLKQTFLQGFFLRLAKIHCRQPIKWCCCRQSPPILQETVESYLLIISLQMNCPILITSRGIQSTRKRLLSSTGGTFKIHRKIFCLCVYVMKPVNTNIQ